MTHISMWVDSGISETKSQKVSCAVAACGIALCGSGFAAWTRSGNFIASWMKNTGDVVAHQIPVALVRIELHRESAYVARPCRPSPARRRRWRSARNRRAFAGFARTGAAFV